MLSGPMRPRVLLALLLAAATAAVVVVRGDDPSPVPPPVGSVTLVGDSLNVGIEPYLAVALDGWTIHNRNLGGRATRAGLEVLRHEGARLAPRVVISLGTNDPRGDAAGFRRNVREALALAGPGRCVVWVNLAGASGTYEELNRVLRDEARRVENLRVVDWAGMLAEHPEWLAADGVHGTEAGYARRADAVAAAVRACRPPGESS